MAIAFDASSSGSVDSTSLTFSHTCSGEDRILFVSGVVSSQSITGMTYNGDAMTLIANFNKGARQEALYYLVNPDTGTHDVVITISGSDNIGGASASYTGVAQTDPIDAFATTTNTSTSITQSVTSTVDNDWIMSGGFTLGSTATGGADTTVRESHSSLWNPFITDRGSYLPTQGTYSQTVNCTSGDNAICVVAFKTSDTSNPGFLALL